MILPKKKILQKKKQHEIEILTTSAANDVASHQGDWISGGDSRSWRLGGKKYPGFPGDGGDAFIFGILCYKKTVSIYIYIYYI